MALTEKLGAIADAIRAKTGKEEGLTLDAMPTEIEGIKTGGELKAIAEKTITIIDDNTINKVGDMTFWWCTKLQSVNLPNCTKLGFNAFYECQALKNVNIPLITEIGTSTFTNTLIEVANFPLVTTTGREAFGNCKQLREVNMPLLTVVGGQNGYNGAFQNCISLEEINLPNVEKIEVRGFNGCKALKKIYCPKVTFVNNTAFYGCSALEKIDFHEPVRFGSTNHFYNCTALKAVIMRGDALSTLETPNTSFTNTPIANGTGYYYVPRALLSDDDATKDYRRATNWATYASKFRALEDYTVDGTITGELDESKI